MKSVAEKTGKIDDVAHSTDYIYMCSEPGQQIIREAIREKGLEGVVVACCSPSMHENTFRKAVRSQGMNPYLCEIANIREQCSWVHQKDKEAATRKAEEIIKATLEKVRKNESLEAIGVSISRRVMVIGGGIAGLTASLDLAEGGYEVVLVERESSLGGHMAQLSTTFPDNDPALCGLISRASERGEASADRSALLLRSGGCERVCGKLRRGPPEKGHLGKLGKVHRMRPLHQESARWRPFPNLRGGWGRERPLTSSSRTVSPTNR